MNRIVVLLLALTLGPRAAPPTDILVALAGTPSPEHLRGLEFGEIEMAQTARLLGFSLRRVPADTAGAYGLVAADDAGPPPAGRPVIRLSGGDARENRCQFGIEAPGTDGAVLWHASLERFGASELNERFARRYDAPMTPEAWAGWAAMKALVESALRRRGDEDPCSALARLRFDGHKGRPLFFAPDTGLLVQPTYLVKDGRVIGERQ